MILELKKISKSFGGVKAINETSFSVSEGEIFALIGPNGAGKTTLFNIITGNYKPTSGEVLFKGQRIDTLKPHKIVHCGIARTFQNIRLFSSMNVLENVLIGFNNQMKYSILEAFLHLGRFSRMESEFKDRAYMLLKELELDNVAYHKATSLSYGQQRKVEIARAMATNPSLLLLDEPAAGMNGAESGALADLIFKLRKDYKMGILLIEHDMKFVNKLCDRVLVLDYGKTIFEGKLSDAINHKEVIAAYLGDFDADC
ncbi:ABC transporter ATP-binding protein [Campylobacter upsaliensis]|uniref:ABC transporter ATP-binding protein n=1 Tax=Campylobacter upsaliensis TaxID=28080 RepID=UPI00127DDF52|nr:ABC transporter ATP-binding protein [Campylobacter upsaliensis]EAI7263872.1 ABC transporter ATP-binding protein [Campylobacter upsaliensis]EAK0456104.1 ABC transporter ATP-binding protein [Campylobacter upsaliensis]EAK6152085.1 ABC transporter ATP-binding protein [Campylobacter upsaliensis]EAL0006894.1 ABC transporter ATP-binding protein [Campylobacter upsaliensis]EAL4539341.1 ABC transporter ATP-binding protein [Campylobacter upsaliensis]